MIRDAILGFKERLKTNRKFKISSSVLQGLGKHNTMPVTNGYKGSSVTARTIMEKTQTKRGDASTIRSTLK